VKRADGTANQPLGDVGVDVTGDPDPLDAPALKRRRHRLAAPYGGRVLDQVSDQVVGPPSTNPGDLSSGRRRHRRSVVELAEVPLPYAKNLERAAMPIEQRIEAAARHMLGFWPAHGTEAPPRR